MVKQTGDEVGQPDEVNESTKDIQALPQELLPKKADATVGKSRVPGSTKGQKEASPEEQVLPTQCRTLCFQAVHVSLHLHPINSVIVPVSDAQTRVLLCWQCCDWPGV